MAEVTVFADDLTGALDAGVKLTGQGHRVAVSWRPTASGCPVVVFDTETRHETPERAAVCLSRWSGLASGIVLKKMDSTLRGPFAAEAEALSVRLGCRGYLVCPASPGTGRTVVGGRLLVDGLPVAETAFAQDPHWPVRDARITHVIAEQSSAAAESIPLETVHRGVEAVVSRLRLLSGAVVADAETDSDLEVLAQALLAGAGWLAVGSAGLAAAMAQALGWQAPQPASPAPPQLVLCGSLHPRSAEQLRTACRGLSVRPIEVSGTGIEAQRALVRQVWERKGLVVLSLPAARLAPAEAESSLRAMAGLAARAVSELGMTRLFATGGSTLLALAKALSLEALYPQGEVAPGVVCSTAGQDDGGQLAIVSKAGGFGDAGLLLRLCRDHSDT